MLQKIWQKWKAFGEILGNILARVVLTLFYFTVFVPFAIGARLFGDRLEIKSPPAALWRARTLTGDSLENARRQA
ncbi:MAG TPA: hypothetical protein VFF68_04455 [Anaerolineaceae bacterium]|nr:hypothetical protein [Anaerolineaceae bacterium]